MSENAARTIGDYRSLIKIWECKWCGQGLEAENIDSYPHEWGWDVEGFPEKQWLSVHCPKCEYDWSLNKLGVPR